MPTEELEFLTDGALALERIASGLSIAVPKFRGSQTKGDHHTCRITDKGMIVYPELEPSEHSRAVVSEQVSSGISSVDSLLNGGLECGPVSIISGPTGVGKTTLGTQFMNEAASRDERSVIFLFEETLSTFVARLSATASQSRR